MRKSFDYILALAICGLTAQIASAKITMPSVISDGMVLQQQSKVALWGTTDQRNARITIKTSWDKKKYSVTADEDGKWKVYVETPVYGGPYQIELSDGEKMTLNDVLIGEVWLCSGQSNMDMRVGGRYNDPVIGSLDAIVTSDNPQIRMFTVGAKLVGEPQEDCTGSWEAASSETTPDFSAAGYFFARKLNEVLKMPVGIIHASYGGSRSEAWTSRDGIAPFKGNPGVHNECILYNGMIHPIVGYGIKGCLWYQGEANLDEPDLYMELFPALVADWRKLWGEGDFPFYYAQIAPFRYNKGEGKGKDSAYLREAQLKCLDLIPESGMIVLMDVGDDRTIHPMEKQTVGNRFAYLALSRTYGKKGFPATGPLYKSMEIEDDKAVISFDEVGGGLTTFRQPMTGFEIAGEDRVFHPAHVRYSRDNKQLIVSSPEVKKPAAVRYAFKDYVKGCLYNMSGLPASSFRTDNW